MEKMRLDKFIASQFNLSRSEARTGIKRGNCLLNGETVRDFGKTVDPDTDNITFCGQAINYKKYIYILMNKPSGILSASNDKNRVTVVDLVPPELKRNGLFPVGRLDKDTTGLLLITDDGDFAHKVISPKYDIEKRYIAYLDGDITDEMIAIFKKGVVLADGTKCKSALLERLCENTAAITVTEGKYHQIKRMFGVVGLGVNRLHRESIGHIKVPENLVFGQCVEISSSFAQSLCL